MPALKLTGKDKSIMAYVSYNWSWLIQPNLSTTEVMITNFINALYKIYK